MSEPTSTAAVIYLSVTKYILPLLPGAVGAAISLKFLGESLNIWQKITTFLCGWACALYLAPFVIEVFSIIGTRSIAGVEFLVGLFALATCRELFKEINNADIIKTILNKYFGVKNDKSN